MISRAALVAFSLLIALSYVEAYYNNNYIYNRPTKKIQISKDGCGWSPAGMKIAKDSGHDELPWMAAIFDMTSGKFVCGCSVIAPNVVLTAAHYVNNSTYKLVVRAGAYKKETKIMDVIKLVKDIVIHKDYNSGNLRNDVALLILQSDFDWQNNIRPICLPDANLTSFDYNNCYVNRWNNQNLEKSTIYANELEKIKLPVIPHNNCQEQLRRTRLGEHFQLHESFLCAGGEENKDACKGDGGSPLICPIPGFNNRYFQAGIVSWGIGCDQNVPGVYANVITLRLWIANELNKRHIKSNHFTAPKPRFY